MLRWIATLVLGSLLLLDLALPSTGLGRRGAEAAVRNEAPASSVRLGDTLPSFALEDLEGEPFDLAKLRGHRVLLTFERSVDW